MLELAASHTHLYRGARGRILRGIPKDGPVLVEFADGTSAQGALTGQVLELPPHVTAAGTRIAARRWRVSFGDTGFRIEARLA